MAEYKFKTTKLEEAARAAYKKVEETTVGAYKAVEGAAVGTYKKIEDAFVAAFLEKLEEEENAEGKAAEDENK